MCVELGVRTFLTEKRRGRGKRMEGGSRITADIPTLHD
jgi:hypothetical protein